MRRHIPIALLALAAGIFLLRCSLEGAAAEDGPEILEIHQGTFLIGDHPLQVEWSTEERLLDLRRNERLDDVVAGARNDLERFERLTSWARSQFEPGDPDPYPLNNGIAILHDIRSGKTQGFCAQYTFLLADALKSFGEFTLRYVELESESGAGHFALEAWSNDLGRWILLDPLNAAIYLKAQAPQSAFELHEALLGGRSAEISIRALPFQGKPITREPAALLALFYNVAVSTRNDFARLDHPLTIPERERIFVRFADARCAPFRHLDFRLTTMRRDEFQPAMNQVAIESAADSERAVLHLTFSTRGTCPHFSNYRVRIGERPWANAGSQLAWSLAPGENVLEVRTVNVFEVLGPVFRIRVRA